MYGYCNCQQALGFNDKFEQIKHFLKEAGGKLLFEYNFCPSPFLEV